MTRAVRGSDMHAALPEEGRCNAAYLLLFAIHELIKRRMDKLMFEQKNKGVGAHSDYIGNATGALLEQYVKQSPTSLKHN
ncbi:hypothetical protein AT59_12550 [Aeromonas hydrophila AD9]|nr:hypothetical protein AT59_12550 [Aeromonas hydrophila AD9]